MSTRQPLRPDKAMGHANAWSLSDPLDLRAPPGPISWTKIVLGCAVAAFLLPPLVAGNNPGVRTFALVFLCIVLEALPFMLVGSCVGGLIEVFVSRERLTSFLPRKPWAVTCMAAAMGLVFPVCECAVVPVLHRLMRKGFPLSAAVAYLLGGPIINPLVGASTLLAYTFDWAMVVTRLGAGYLIAVSVGLLMGRIFAQRQAVLDSGDPSQHGHGSGCEHQHDHEACDRGHGHGAHEHGQGLFGRLTAAIRHASDDFLAVAHYLVIGAAIAALSQIVLERRAMLTFAARPVLPSLAMMLLAILLNLCGEFGPNACLLYRFVVRCCVADAMPVAVLLVGELPADSPDDTWIRAEGTFKLKTGGERDVICSISNAPPRSPDQEIRICTERNHMSVASTSGMIGARRCGCRAFALSAIAMILLAPPRQTWAQTAQTNRVLALINGEEIREAQLNAGLPRTGLGMGGVNTRVKAVKHERLIVHAVIAQYPSLEGLTMAAKAVDDGVEPRRKTPPAAGCSCFCIERWSLDATFAKAVDVLKSSVVSKRVRTQGGVHIIRRDAASADDVSKVLRKEWTGRRRNEIWQTECKGFVIERVWEGP